MNDLGRRVRETFDVDDALASAVADGDAPTIAGRLANWSRERVAVATPEHLLPRICRTIHRSPPGYMTDPHDALGRSSEDLEARVAELDPWQVPFTLDHGIVTMPDELVTNVTRTRLSFRRDLIVGTIRALLGDEVATSSFLDIGCNSGYFSLELASQGAARVDGVDRHPLNIEQARFLAEHYGIEGVRFSLGDVADLDLAEQWDVVLNLGVLYHVTDPVALLRQTFELTRRFAIVDTICHQEPVSALIVIGDKDTTSQVEGRESIEFLPTYRACVDLLRHVGFAEVFEVAGTARHPHDSYAKGRRRCFLAVK